MDNSANNHVVARIEENTLERNSGGIIIRGGFGAETVPLDTPTRTVQNVVDVRIERNTLKNHENGVNIFGGTGSTDGPSEAVADHNQVNTLVQHNVIEDSTVGRIQLAAGGSGMASENTLQVQGVHSTVCGDGTDIVAEGGFSGAIILPSNPGDWKRAGRRDFQEYGDGGDRGEWNAGEYAYGDTDQQCPCALENPQPGFWSPLSLPRRISPS